MNQDEAIWKQPEKEPSGMEVKRMLAKAVAEEVRFLLRRHTYRYGDQLKIQKEGGAIGSELTQVVSKTRIIVYTWRLKELLEIIEKRWFRYEKYMRRYVSGNKDYTGWKNAKCNDIKLILSRWYVDDSSIIKNRERVEVQ